MRAELGESYPVRTFASGPTNSMRGAAFLSGLQDALVIDIGGTTSDIGALTDGFPRESAVAASIAGVRTNFRMPDIVSLGLGGGSIVHTDSIGPESVGLAITDRALVFGGDVLTATDLAVAGGLAEVGDSNRTANLDDGQVRAGLLRIRQTLEERPRPDEAPTRPPAGDRRRRRKHPCRKQPRGSLQRHQAHQLRRRKCCRGGDRPSQRRGRARSTR